MFWKAENNNSLSFNNLQFFDVVMVRGSKSELKFIEYIFGNTPSLEVSKIEIDWKHIPFGGGQMGDILIELLSYKKVSTAEVIIGKPNGSGTIWF